MNRLGETITSAAPVSRQVKIELDDGTERTADHLLLGTGYRVDLSKYEFLAPDLLRSIHRFNGFPVLKKGLETSVPALHILGAPATWGFGPLMQFVSGTNYASHATPEPLYLPGVDQGASRSDANPAVGPAAGTTDYCFPMTWTGPDNPERRPHPENAQFRPTTCMPSAAAHFHRSYLGQQ
jgi:hypothetical protein